MDFWVMVRENAMFLVLFGVVLLTSILLFVATWKGRASLPKGLVGVLTGISGLFVLASLTGIVFLLSMGYNS